MANCNFLKNQSNKSTLFISIYHGTDRDRLKLYYGNYKYYLYYGKYVNCKNYIGYRC